MPNIHWSIDPDTPYEMRENAHKNAQLVAEFLTRVKPERAIDQLEFLVYKPATEEYWVEWPDGKREWVATLLLHSLHVRIPKGSCY